MRIILAVAAAAALAGGCADSGDEITVSPVAGVAGQIGTVAVRDLFILGGDGQKPLPAGGSAPVYLTLVNQPAAVETIGPSGTPDPEQGVDYLDSVSSPVAGSAELIGGPIRVPAGTDVRVGPAARIVLRGLTRELTTGDTFPVTLTFRRAGSGTIPTPVAARAGSMATFSPAPR